MIQRLLIIRFSALGDVAMMVPVIKALSEQYPQLRVTVMTQYRWVTLFGTISPQVETIGVDLKEEHQGMKGLRWLSKIIRKQHFDAIADMHGVWRSHYLMMHQRCPHKATIRKHRLSRWQLTHGKDVTVPTTFERYADVLKRLGLPISLSVEPIKNSGERHGIGIAPFAGHKGKVYPINRMEQVVQRLSEKMHAMGETLYLFGGGREECAVLNEWAEKYPHVESVAGKYTMGEEMDLMQSLRLMLTMDSGNMHLASLVNTRVISIWGATHPKTGFLGWGQKTSDCIQRELPCRPCSIYGKKKCRYGDYRCLMIEPATVVQAIEKALSDTI